MSSHRSSSSSSAARKRDDEVEPVKLSFREMLSYGHKPWDEDYREQKQALEEAFTQGQRQAAAQEKRSSNQKQLSPNQTGHSTSYDDVTDNDYGVKPVKFTEEEMLCYGHKPWDNDYYEWKEAYEEAFTKSERQAAAEAHREARASKRGNT